MNSTQEQIQKYINSKKDTLINVSKFLWDNPETSFNEFKSSNYLCEVLESEGFEIERNVGNIKTAFVGTFGKSGPVIGFLGEFDALSGLSQESNLNEKNPIIQNGNGHGCGHNLLGTGSLAAAFAIKDYLEKNEIKGTVKYIGCPAEESGSGKAYMARAGVFDDLDIALTWHPSPGNGILMTSGSLANYQIAYQFKGISSHAAQSPHLGRSALDAVELTNVGVNYLREHIKPDARVHYAITNTGGSAPNVVQSEAEVLYLMRSPNLTEAKSIFNRVTKISEGAALMTETEVSLRFDSAVSNYVPNKFLEKIMYLKFTELGTVNYTTEEINYAKRFWDTFTDQEKEDALDGVGMPCSREEKDKIKGKYLSDIITSRDTPVYGSTDVGDVSWVVPTAQCTVATGAIGTPLHSWQMVSQGISSIAHKGMLHAGTVMALTATEIIKYPEYLNEIKKEHTEIFGSKPYESPIPKNIHPPIISE